LRRHMDSQGFVALEFIAAFNRIKSLSTDIELLKLVCQQSSHVQYRTGEDGRDRLRRREGWEQWVLAMADRDESAQNEGPKELHNPPVPNPAGFDQSNPPQYPTVQTGYGQDVSVPNIPQDAATAPTEDLTNGTSTEGANGTAVPNGQPIEESTKAVSPEPDSIIDAQMESLTVVVRKATKSSTASRPKLYE
jgi:la-related protein 1